MAQARPTVYEFVPQLGQLRDDVLFADVWEHPDLGKRDRSLVTGNTITRRQRLALPGAPIPVT
jgi:4-carboxymuconolactone decarboxylase